MDIEKLRQVLSEGCGLSPGAKILAGVSGGADSLCLLGVLVELGYDVVVAHYNHGLRPDAGQDASRVESAAARMGLPFVLGGSDVAALAEGEGLSIEEAARTARYRFLFGEARRLGARAVAAGHTADDQVETVLMHFLRGAGLAGLKGMPACAVLPEWDDEIVLVRPLLNVWRSETEAYCAAHGLEPVFDSSNLDTTFYRNRLRHELIPYLQQYNPQIKEVVWRTAQAVAGDAAVLENLTRAAWQRCLLEESQGFVVLSLPELSSLELGLQRGVLRHTIGRLRPGLRNIDFSAIERAVQFVAAPTRTGFLDLVSGLYLSLSRDRLFVVSEGSPVQLKAWPQIEPGTEMELPVPGRLELGSGWVLKSEWTSNKPPSGPGEQYQDPNHAWLDAACLAQPLTVRTRRPGDRFRPLGMQGHSVKLSDFFINAQLPRPARAGWPLVCSGDAIVWVCAYRPADPCRLRHETTQAVHLWLELENA